MLSRPKNVFTTDNTSGRVVAPDEYTIKSKSGNVLLVFKGFITLDAVKKAAKCGNLSKFYVRKLHSASHLTSSDFPIKGNLVVGKIVSAPIIVSRNLPVRVETTYKIFKSEDMSELAVIEGRLITKSDLDKAAKCAGFKKYKVSKRLGAAFTAGDNVTFNHDVYLHKSVASGDRVFHVCESTSIVPVKRSTKKVVSANVSVPQKACVRDAIQGLTIALKALKSLEKLL